MEINEYIAYELAYIKRGLNKTLDGLTPTELAWQPGSGSNSIGLILFHVVRSEDSFVQGRLREKPQIWVSENWFQRFNMTETETGSHFTVDQVNAFKVPELNLVTEYFEAVRTHTHNYLNMLKPTDFDRKFTSPRLGEMSVGAMFSLIIGHEQQHVGEIGYLRGLQRGMDK